MNTAPTSSPASSPSRCSNPTSRSPSSSWTTCRPPISRARPGNSQDPSMRLHHAFFAALCLLGASAVRADDWVTYEPRDGAGKGKNVVFLAGDEEYRSEEGLPMMAKILSQRHGFRCTVLFAQDSDGTINPNNQKSLPGAEALDTADAIVMLLRYRQWPDDVMKHFVYAYQRGVPIVGLRTSTHAFNYVRGTPTAY